MVRGISPVSIIMGFLVSQAIGSLVATIMVFLFLFIYGNSFIVAILEYPSSIAITMILTLLSVAVSGYISMLFKSKSIINPIMVGLLYLGVNIWFLYLIDFKYGTGHMWMLIVTGILIIPSAVSGYYVYTRNHSVK